MIREKDRVENPAVRMQTGSPKESLDSRLLGQAVIELNIARKNCCIYPAGHIQVDRSIDRAHLVLQKLMEPVSQLTIGVAKDCLFFGDDYLDQKNAVYKDFSLSLYSRDIAALTFVKGLQKEEISRFCRILTIDTEEIREKGGISQAMGEAQITRLVVQPIDYTRLHLTEEEEIDTSKSRGKLQLSRHAWQTFVGNLVSDQLDVKGRFEPLLKRNRVSPAEIAALLNSGALNVGSALKSYEETIAKTFRQTTGIQPLEDFCSLLRDLRPMLRNQFLSLTFDCVAGTEGEEVLGCFTDDLVLEMLTNANDEGREISPTLMSLLEKMSRIGITAPSAYHEGRCAPSTEESEHNASRELIRTLLHRESYDTYVDANYRSLLKNLINTQPASGQDGKKPQLQACPHEPQPPSGTRPEAVQVLMGCPEDLDDSQVDLQLTGMLVALMDREIDEDNYCTFAKTVAECVPDLVRSGEYDVCLEVVQALQRHARFKPEPSRKAALECLGAFSAGDLIAHVVAVFDTFPDEKSDTALSLLRELGVPCIPCVMDAYAGDEYPSRKGALLDVLLGFGRESLDEAHARFQDSPEHSLRNLLVLVQRIGSEESIAHVRSLLNHDGHLVRMDALVTLLELRDPQAFVFLRRVLHSLVDEEASRAILLAGSYRVDAIVDDLARMIKRMPLLRSSYRKNEAIIRSLGRIGDVRVIPLLEKLVRRSWTVYPRSLKRMKLTLYETLSGYPRESVTELLKMGRQSKDRRIQMISEKLSRQDDGRSSGS